MKLLLPPNVQRLTEGDRVIFFNPDVPSWVVTDNNGATVLSLCDGTMTLEEGSADKPGWYGLPGQE